MWTTAVSAADHGRVVADNVELHDVEGRRAVQYAFSSTSMGSFVLMPSMSQLMRDRKKRTTE